MCFRKTSCSSVIATPASVAILTSHAALRRIERAILGRQAHGVIKGVDSDIFIKDFRDDGTPPNLTSTTDIAEDFPVVSHDGTMIAYRAHHPDEAQSWEIRVARLTLPSTLTLLYPIRFTDPASGLIGAPEFSSDDKRIYVSGYLTEQETSQLFSINLDGSGQFQVTVTDERDYGPSVVPR